MKEIDIKFNESTDVIDNPVSDGNISIDEIFQQCSVESLGKRVCSVIPINIPHGGIFNIKKKESSNDFEVVRSTVQLQETTPIKTGVSQETITDIRNLFGKEANSIIGNLFRGLANSQENEKLLLFLNSNAKETDDLNLSDSLNADTNIAELMQRINELVLKMNEKTFRTYDAFAILPSIPLASMYSYSKLYGHHEEFKEDGLFLSKVASTRFYMNPDQSDNNVYVGLKDLINPGKSSIIFSPYQSQIVEATEYDTGNLVYVIFNRFAITISPLHTTGNEMLYKFQLKI